MKNIKVVEKELNRAERNWFKSTISDEDDQKELRKLTDEYFSIVNQKNDIGNF